MKLKITDDSIIVLIYILSNMMIIGQLFGIHAVTSIAYALSFVAVFGIWCLQLKEFRVLDLVSLIIIALSFISTLITCTSFSVNYFTNWLIFSFVFLYFPVCLKIRVNTQTVGSIFKINTVVIVLCCVAYVFRYKDAFYVTFSGVRYLNFDFYNPNCLALFLVCIAITGILANSFSERFQLCKQILTIGLFAILIAQTLSRTVLIAFLCFVAIYLVFKRKQICYLPQGTAFKFIVSAFPLIFAFVYMVTIDILANNDIFSFLISEGKEIDSRQLVWEYAFDLFKKSPFLGSYNELIQSSIAKQVHNSHLNVLASYGFVTFILVVLFLFLVITEAIQNSKKTKMELSSWAFIVCLLLGCGESILFSGGLSFYLLVGQFLLFTNINTDDGSELICGITSKK